MQKLTCQKNTFFRLIVLVNKQKNIFIFYKNTFYHNPRDAKRLHEYLYI